MDFLDKIIKNKRFEVDRIISSGAYFENKLISACHNLPVASSFISKLEKAQNNNKIALIAEVKKASPSKGLIREDFKPLEIALEYQSSGAGAVSVLTEEKYFLGSLDYLKEIKKQVKIPVLRKDFIIHPYQVYESRLAGADLILLIASALDEKTFRELYLLSKEIGLEVLAEVHDKDELDFVMKTGCRIIGINNRNLKTFEVSTANTIDLIKGRNFENRFIISESGIKSHNDVKLLHNAGVNGILVGEHFMRQKNISKAVKDLLGNLL